MKQSAYEQINRVSECSSGEEGGWLQLESGAALGRRNGGAFGFDQVRGPADVQPLQRSKGILMQEICEAIGPRGELVALQVLLCLLEQMMQMDPRGNTRMPMRRRKEGRAVGHMV